MTVLRSILLFVLAALAEIGGAWLVWQGAREHRGLVFVGAGILALGLYGFVATFQPDPHFGRILPPMAGCLWPARWPGVCSSMGSGPIAMTW
jgi:small multidrug resistance family-3 protein